MEGNGGESESESVEFCKGALGQPKSSHLPLDTTKTGRSLLGCSSSWDVFVHNARLELLREPLLGLSSSLDVFVYDARPELFYFNLCSDALQARRSFLHNVATFFATAPDVPPDRRDFVRSAPRNHVRMKFLRNLESTNLSRDKFSREIGRTPALLEGRRGQPITRQESGMRQEGAIGNRLYSIVYYNSFIVYYSTVVCYITVVL